jgi:hypothetical protein
MFCFAWVGLSKEIRRSRYSTRVAINAPRSLALHCKTVQSKYKASIVNNVKLLTYDERMVAFVDVLGFAKIVEASETDPDARIKVSQIIATDQLFERFMKNMYPLVDATFFSDSFVLSAPAGNTIYLMREAGYLCRHLLTSGFLFRGAIVAGALHHDNRTIVGPAFVKAYRLERDVALYPRVIVDASALEYWNEELTEGSAHPQLASLTKVGPDGQCFLDIFDPQWATAFVPWTDLEPSENVIPTAPIDFLDVVREYIQNGIIAHASNERVREKYAWLASEFNVRASTLGISPCLV